MRFSDFHIHPDYSIDARGSIDDYCRRALEVGIESICFTTHYDSNPKRIAQDAYWNFKGEKVRYSDKLVDQYISDIESARDVYAERGLNILRGLEIDYYPGVEKETERLRSVFPLDFVIGSVHCINDIAISDPREAPGYFNSRTVDQMADDYFNLLEQAASCLLFDSIGHMDYYARFGGKYYGDDMNKIEIERFDPVFHKLIANRIGFELNTNPFKRGISDFHPSRKIATRAFSIDVPFSSVGSDSHIPDELGRGLTEAFDFLEMSKITPIFPRKQ